MQLPMDAYAGTAKGAAMYAIDRWHDAHRMLKRSHPEEDRALLGGRMQAFAAICRLLTGRNPDEKDVNEIIRSMA